MGSVLCVGVCECLFVKGFLVAIHGIPMGCLWLTTCRALSGDIADISSIVKGNFAVLLWGHV